MVQHFLCYAFFRNTKNSARNKPSSSLNRFEISNGEKTICLNKGIITTSLVQTVWLNRYLLRWVTTRRFRKRAKSNVKQFKKPVMNIWPSSWIGTIPFRKMRQTLKIFLWNSMVSLRQLNARPVYQEHHPVTRKRQTSAYRKACRCFSPIINSYHQHRLNIVG